jgi:NTP pyrophosphatase (non-canonical NTP hydrolase)
MDLDEYQKRAEETAIYPDKIFLRDTYTSGAAAFEERMSWIYPVLGLAGEVGELANKLKKIIRDYDGRIDDESGIIPWAKNELGDILWYIAMIAKELGLSLNAIAGDNLIKLAKRAEEGKLHGEGDER